MYTRWWPVYVPPPLPSRYGRLSLGQSYAKHSHLHHLFSLRSLISTQSCTAPGISSVSNNIELKQSDRNPSGNQRPGTGG